MKAYKIWPFMSTEAVFMLKDTGYPTPVLRSSVQASVIKSAGLSRLCLVRTSPKSAHQRTRPGSKPICSACPVKRSATARSVRMKARPLLFAPSHPLPMWTPSWHLAQQHHKQPQLAGSFRYALPEGKGLSTQPEIPLKMALRLMIA